MDLRWSRRVLHGSGSRGRRLRVRAPDCLCRLRARRLNGQRIEDRVDRHRRVVCGVAPTRTGWRVQRLVVPDPQMRNLHDVAGPKQRLRHGHAIHLNAVAAVQVLDDRASGRQQELGMAPGEQRVRVVDFTGRVATDDDRADEGNTAFTVGV